MNTSLLLALAVLTPLARPAKAQVAAAKAAAKAESPESRTVVLARPALGRIAPGWPQLVPGSVTGTPVVADLERAGVPVVAAPVMHRPGFRVLHAEPDVASQIFAFHADGRPLSGWPAVLTSTAVREAALLKNAHDPFFNSPTVVDINGDGIEELVMPTLSGLQKVWSDATTMKLPGGGDPWASVPAADLDGDGVADLLMGWVLTDVRDATPKTWPKEKILRGGYAPCIGDADGDGDMEVFHPHYAEDGNILGGYDHTGTPLAGWPQKMAAITMSPVMGDVWGDAKMEVCALDSRGNLHLWTHDGQPLPSTSRQGEMTSVFKSGAWSWRDGSPTLADLDGDGKAEIILHDGRTNRVLAWHGDGRGVASEDGTLCVLPRPGGNKISVADLGGDGEMDLFCGLYWIRLAKDGAVTIAPMAEQEEEPRDEPVQTAVFDPATGQMRAVQTRRYTGTLDKATAASIADLGGDGKADVIFGTGDGRLFVFETGMAYRPEWVQWATEGGDFQHTGAWHKPTPRK